MDFGICLLSSLLLPWKRLLQSQCDVASAKDKHAASKVSICSAQRYGPEAIRKIMATFGATAKTWPEGKAVKIAFHQKDSANDTKTVMWKPERRYFHEVIMNLASGIVIQDFEVSYEDKDGVKIELDATKLDIEDYLADFRDEPNPKLKAGWYVFST